MAGISLTRRLDTSSSSAVELFAGVGSVPVAGQGAATALRYGLFFNKAIPDTKGQERWNVIVGALYGTESRAVAPGLPTRGWASFMEVDYAPRPGLMLLARQDWTPRQNAGGVASGLTLGAAIDLTRSLRLDTDVILHRPGQSRPQIIGRLRLVY